MTEADPNETARIDNPLAGALDVRITVPEVIRTRMVNADVLSDYELWFSISSGLGSAFTGFAVAAVSDVIQASRTNPVDAGLVIFSGLLLVMFIVSIGVTLNRRGRLTGETIEVAFGALPGQAQTFTPAESTEPDLQH